MSDNRIPPRSRHDFNIALICALPLEASAVSALFDSRYDVEKYGKEQVDTNAYSLGMLGPHNVVLVHMPNMGKVAAATAAANLRASFRGIRLALVVGICGGAPFRPSGELLLGDVVISEGLVQYDLGRQLPHTFVRKDTPVENLPRPKPEVRAALAKLRTSQGRFQLQKQMLEHLRLLRQRSDLTIPYPGPKNDQLFKPKYLHRHHPPSECAVCSKGDGDGSCSSAMEASCEELGCGELDPRTRSRLIGAPNESQPIVHFGLVATGDTVMRSGKDRDRIAARDNVIAFEMEGAGVWEMFPAAFVIKGVCDYADSHKNKTWQGYAAATAAAAAKAFLEHREITLSISSISLQHLHDGSVGDPKTRQLEARELEMLKRLYTSPYRDRKERNPSRVAGTCEWFIQHHLFRDWRQRTSSRMLWVSADPGCGKSVLVKYLVDSIILTTTTRTVCYFFFKDDFEDQKSIVSALCCILYQLFQQNPALLSKAIFNQFEAGGERFLASFSELWHILLTAAQDAHAGEIVCILDAIDECDDHGRAQLAKELCKLYGPDCKLNVNLKFLVTSRPFGKIRQDFQSLQFPGLPIIHLSGESDEEMEKISAEIDIYIRARVEDIGQRLDLRQEERHILLTELIKVPNRTYLWVYLILDLVESDINIDRTGILQATAQIPRTVDEAYDRILSKSYDLQEASKILHIIVAAERALTLEELGFALAIRQWHRSHNDIDMKNQIRLRENIRDACGLFVIIINSKVFLLHQTAKEFLVQSEPPKPFAFLNMILNWKHIILPQSFTPVSVDLKWKHILLPQKSHQILAEICIWYLLLSEQEYEPLSEDHGAQSTSSRILLDYSANYWATHLRESHMQISMPMAQSILTICDSNSIRCELWLKVFWKKTHTIFPEQFTTLMVISYFGLDAVVKMVLSEMIDDRELNARDRTYGRSALSWAAGNGFEAVVEFLIMGQSGWLGAVTSFLFGDNNEINSVDNSGRTPLLYAIWNGNVAVVKALLNAKAQVNLTDHIGGTPLFYAMIYRRKTIVKLLLEHEAIQKAEDEMVTSLLFSAVRKSDVQAIQLFLDSGIDVESRDRDKKTPLLLAVERRDLNTVHFLLNQGADIESRRHHDDDTPLLIAINMRDSGIVRLLLHYGANTEALSKHNDTPLLAAIKMGELDIVQLLLARGANTETMPNGEYTPLAYAVKYEKWPFIRALLSRGNTVESKDNKFADTLLLLAAKRGHLDVVQMVLERGASVEARDDRGCTPLIHAAEEGHLDITQHLLRQGAPIETIYENRRTQLSYAVKCGYRYAVKFLLDHGAKIDAKESRSLLYYATQSGLRDVFRLLLTRGANIEARDSKYGRTLLFLAARDRNIYTTQLLLDLGADVDAKDKYYSTPLACAVRENENRQVIQLLIDRGADIEAKTFVHCTPLMQAAMVGNHDAIELLLDRGADIEARDKLGRTPLIHAITHGKAKVGASLSPPVGRRIIQDVDPGIKLLIDRGANINSIESNRRTPLFYAIISKNDQLIQFLLDKGADIRLLGARARMLLLEYQHSISK